MHTRLRPAVALVLALALGASAAACSSSGGSLTVTGPWARQSMAMASAGAAYMVITNSTSEADTLLGGSTPVAASVEVHETYKVESTEPGASMGTGGMESPKPGAMESMGTGMLGMRQIERLEISAGGTVELKPGGYHLMLIGLNQELVVGETIELTLNFEKAGEVKVTAEVRAN